MKIGALIVTTGLPRVSGVAALLPAVGAISAGQRMISAFQCADVSLVGLVVGPEDKKSERQLAKTVSSFCAARKKPAFSGACRKDFPLCGANSTGFLWCLAMSLCFFPLP
jgi:hypothetical protein